MNQPGQDRENFQLPAAEARLGALLEVIHRMAANSSSCKTWCLTLVSAILVIVVDQGQPRYALLALLPTILFLYLDSYYLSLERRFRFMHDGFLKRMLAGDLSESDYMFGQISQLPGARQWHSIWSPSIWPFYFGLAVLVLAARFFIVGGR